MGIELIGRHREHLDIADRLRIRRLVTVIGPAGVGKTAVARAVAQHAETPDTGRMSTGDQILSSALHGEVLLAARRPELRPPH